MNPQQVLLGPKVSIKAEALRDFEGSGRKFAMTRLFLLGRLQPCTFDLTRVGE
jgi:hypothetical protein